MSQELEELANRTQADKSEYKEHIVFKELDRAIDFYDSLDFSVMRFVTVGTRAIIKLIALFIHQLREPLNL